MSEYSAGQSPPPVQSGITLAKTGLGTSNTATDSVTEAWQPLASVTTKVTGTSVTPPPSKTIKTEGLTNRTKDPTPLPLKQIPMDRRITLHLQRKNQQQADHLAGNCKATRNPIGRRRCPLLTCTRTLPRCPMVEVPPLDSTFPQAGPLRHPLKSPNLASDSHPKTKPKTQSVRNQTKAHL